jgi:hypothetical protein
VGPPSKPLALLRLKKAADYRVVGLVVATASAAWLPLTVVEAARSDLIDWPGGAATVRSATADRRTVGRGAKGLGAILIVIER